MTKEFPYYSEHHGAWIVDGLCCCGHGQEEHHHLVDENLDPSLIEHEGGCSHCGCRRFTWTGWIKKESLFSEASLEAC